jgi:TetR/AcrR family transcriptional regulator, transcriptional repressor for nem operon
MARPKEFDPDQALDAAMRLFWERGYEATSMQDLVERTGVHKRSLYDTFGDKHTLYVRSLDRYLEAAEAQQLAIMRTVEGPRAALRALLEIVIPAKDRPRGCFAVNAATETAPADPDVDRRLTATFATSERLVRTLVTEAQRAGEIAPGRDPEALVAGLHNGWIGLRVRARAGLSAARVREEIDRLMALLD